jgi:hypothetical protein
MSTRLGYCSTKATADEAGSKAVRNTNGICRTNAGNPTVLIQPRGMSFFIGGQGRKPRKLEEGRTRMPGPNIVYRLLRRTEVAQLHGIFAVRPLSGMSLRLKVSTLALGNRSEYQAYSVASYNEVAAAMQVRFGRGALPPRQAKHFSRSAPLAQISSE